MYDNNYRGPSKKIAFKNASFKPRKKRPGFWKNIKDYFSDFSRHTTLNGFQYLGEQERSRIEKIWWFVVIAFSLCVSIVLITQTYNKWNDSPVIVSFAQSPTKIWEIPFPAITVCPEIKSKQTIFNYTNYFNKYQRHENMTEEEEEMYLTVAQMCDDTMLGSPGKLIAGLNVVEFINKVSVPMNESMTLCRWSNHSQFCRTVFTKILSEEGICFSFNMLGRDEIYTSEVFYEDFLTFNGTPSAWSLEEGYRKDAGIETFPRRAMSAGIKGGLTATLEAEEKDLDYICRGPVQGFKILLHNPGEVPRVSMQYFRVPLNQEIAVVIKPDMMTTSDGLRGFDPRRRGCYFSWEKQLRFYKKYTQQNCDVECLTNATLEKCGCVAYHMPHLKNTPICGSGSLNCMKEAEVEIVAGDVERGITGETGDQSCDCMPACTTLTYNAEVTQADFDFPKHLQAYGISSEAIEMYSKVKVTQMQFFFKEFQFMTSHRKELYGSVDFLASVGGILGLFIGFSFISVVEVVYYLTIRLWINIKRYGRHHWAGSEDLRRSHPQTNKISTHHM